jgi:hypothetical protein
MKKFIIKALDEALVHIYKITPTTKIVERSVSVMHVMPKDILTFMKENSIPDDACFAGKDNGYDGFDDILLSWDIKVPTTEEDRLKYRRERFNSVSFKRLHDLLTANGYKRVGYNTRLLKEFNDTIVYDMYMNKEWDRLIKYYSLSFKVDFN